MSRVFLGGIIGAVVIFLWMWISWVILPWHNHLFRPFKCQQEVSSMITKNTPENGIYISPFMDCQQVSPEEAKKVMMSEPFIYMQIKKEGTNPYSPMLYVISLTENFIGAFFLCYILRYTKRYAHYFNRVFFAATFGLVVGILAAVPNWNWMNAPGDYTMMVIFDFLISFFLAGLAVSGFVKPPKLEMH